MLGKPAAPEVVGCDPAGPASIRVLKQDSMNSEREQVAGVEPLTWPQFQPCFPHDSHRTRLVPFPAGMS